ncbi:MAG: hypothetical protein R6V06_03220 [Kiritimatiellia bacterium]
MSDQNNNNGNGDAPPRQGPEPSIKPNGYSGSGDLVTMYQAQQAGGADSFPVLQAFQDYIDAERKQARKRVVQLSIAFSAILGVVVVCFLAAGAAILRNMADMQSNTADMQTKLMEIVAGRHNVPAQAQFVQSRLPDDDSSELRNSIREMSRVLVEMQEHAAASSEKTEADLPEKNSSSASADPVLKALRAELDSMKEQSRKMENELVSLRNSDKTVPQRRTVNTSKVVEDALAKARQTAKEKAASDKAAVAAAAAEAEQRRSENEKRRVAVREAEKDLAIKMAEQRKMADRRDAAIRPEKAAVTRKMKTDKKYPAATKAPPVASADVKYPAPPEKMAAQCITLKTDEGGEVPWRIFVPE